MNNSVTLLFPGQGSQYVGMGQTLTNHPAAKIFTEADTALGFSLSSLMLSGPVETLQLTEHTQPAILTYSIALFEKLKALLGEKSIKIERVLGHSVGEYAALVVAQSISFAEAVQAVRLRGQFMQKAVPAGVGKMVAIMRVPQELIIQACQAVSTPSNLVMPANFNEPNQIVISGAAEATDRAVEWLTENFEGRMRSIELKVSAPFHSSLMQPAADELAEALNTCTIGENIYPYIANIDATEYPVGTAQTIIKKNLIDQVAGSVQWTQSILALPSDTLCIEVGPGKVLAGLVKKINPDIKMISLDTEGAFQELEKLL